MSEFRAREGTLRLRRVTMWAVAIASIVVSAPAISQPVSAKSASAPAIQHDNAVHALGLRVGNHGAYRTASIFWQSPALWSHNFNNGWGRLDLLGELSATYWDARHGHHSSMWQGGAAALLRWWPSEAPLFLEAGFGPTFISETRFADYGLSTSLQFGSHVGIGYVFNKKHQISLRGSHFSNARIKRPNDGLNVIQLDYAIRF